VCDLDIASDERHAILGSPALALPAPAQVNANYKAARAQTLSTLIERLSCNVRRL
jgi:hypothetical protein